MKPALRESLAEVGITEQDYQDIKRAQDIVHKVNARLAGRDSPVLFCVMQVTAHAPSAARRSDNEIRET